MNPELQQLFTSPAFWTYPPERQRQEIERLDSRFAGLSEEHFQRGFQMLAGKYRPKTPLQPGPTDIPAIKEIQSGLGAVSDVFKKAHEGIVKDIPGPLKPTTEFINPVPASLPQALGMGVAMAIPGGGLWGPLLRAGGSGVAAGVTAKAMGQEHPDVTAAEQAVGQFAGELPFMAGRSILGQMKGKQAFEAQQAKIKEAEGKWAKFREEKGAFKQSELERKAQFQETQRGLDLQHREGQAAQLADIVKGQVPAWQRMGNTPKDLWSMAFGEEWKLVQNRYDESLRRVVAEGKGRLVQIKGDAAEALGVTGPVGPKNVTKGGTTDYMMVDADELANAMTGKWANRYTRSAYRQAARALDEAGIGDPEARGEYRNASSFRAFADKSQMLEGQEFHPERVQKALGKLRANAEVLGPRQNVELFRGLESSKPRPQIPFTPAKPPTPPAPVPEATITHGPLGARSIPATITGVGGGIAGGILGKEIGHPFLGYSLGHGAGQALGGRIPAYQGGPKVPEPGLLGRGGRATTGEIATQHIKKAWDYIMEEDQ